MLYFDAQQEAAARTDTDDLQQQQRRQAEPYLALVESGLAKCSGPTVPPGVCQGWIELLHREQDGARFALRWLAQHGEVGRGMRLAHALLAFWSRRRHDQDTAIRQLSLAGASVVVIRDALRIEHELSHLLCEESRAVVAAIGTRQRRASTLAEAARGALASGDQSAASVGFTEAANLFGGLGNATASTACRRLAAQCESSYSTLTRPPALPSLPARTERSLPCLSAREREVATLVARGYTSREIAGELHITERTARTHVTHILDKLGFRSRAQIAAWIATAGLH